MKRWIKVLCAVLVILLLSAGGLAWWQWENLMAVKDGLQYTPEEIEGKLQENDQVIKDAVAAAPEVVLRDVTEEERQALKDGTLSPEDLANRLLEAENAPPAGGSDTGTQQTPDAAQQPSEEPRKEPEKEPEKPKVDPDYQKKVSAIIAEVYVLREKFTMQLEQMVLSAKAEYKAMPKEERTTDKLTKWARSYISKASKLERECDAKMDDIVYRLEKLIKENNGDMSLVDAVVYTYSSEKSLKKAWYMSKLEKRGLV